jgi:ribosome-binding protein aMBF1 (putative translation factor)
MFAVVAMDLKRAMAINLRRERHVRELSQEELADRGQGSVPVISDQSNARMLPQALQSWAAWLAPFGSTLAN